MPMRNWNSCGVTRHAQDAEKAHKKLHTDDAIVDTTLNTGVIRADELQIDLDLYQVGE
jgi:hypothetical protein